MTAPDELGPELLAAVQAYLATTVERSAEAGLTLVSPCLLEDAVRTVRLILLAAERARAALPPTPRPSGPVSVADAQALRLDLGAEAVALIAWMPGADDVALALSASGNRNVARRCSAAQFSAVSATIAALIPSPAASNLPEPTP